MKPILYRTKKLTGDYDGQMFFEKRICVDFKVDRINPVSLGGTEKHYCNLAIIAGEINVADKFDKLEFDVLVRKDSEGNIEYRVELHYALEPELQQLFDFINFEERLRRDNELLDLKKRNCKIEK